ncbi:MAG: CoA transferase, partial [Chloroflexi bacterium]|nr:CoA transferase [Chloroflexota bacterium]
SEPMWEIQRSSPLLGQHNTEILVRERTEPSRSTQVSDPSRPLVPFDKIRVIDFTQAVAGPYCTKLLASYGAEVIKLESMSHQQRGRTNARLDEQITLRQRVTFSDINGGKLGAALNLRTEKGRELAKRLIATANVVVENFSPRVMRSWGLDYPELRKIKPDIIMASLPGFGLTGPSAEYLSVASTVMAVTGMMQLWTYPEEQVPFDIPTFQPDYAGGTHAAVAILAALHQWARTGNGQHIEVAQVETAACLLGPTFLEYSVNHRVPQPKGNQNAYAAPYGCYPCKGEDQWCVLAVQTEKEWERFCYVLGDPGWAEDAKFSTVAARLENRTALDAHVAAWTRTQTPFQVMRALQRVGVAAGAVQNSEDLFRDPQLRERGFLRDLHDPAAPGAVLPGPVLRFGGLPGKITRGPEFAEHNAYVYGKILGLPQQEVAALIEEGVIA